jgi:hypothetical protein
MKFIVSNGMGWVKRRAIHSSKGKAYKKIKIKDDFHEHFP